MEDRLKEVLRSVRMDGENETQFQQDPKPLYELIKKYLNKNSVIAEIGSFSGAAANIGDAHSFFDPRPFCLFFNGGPIGFKVQAKRFLVAFHKIFIRKHFVHWF